MNQLAPADREHSRHAKSPKDATASLVWTVIVPFKGGSAAKSRLGSGVPEHAGLSPELRREIALAFLRDTVAAAKSLPSVANLVVVSSDSFLLEAMPGIVLIADPGRGLNAAVAAGVAWAREHQPDQSIAILAGDLPCLVPRDLARTFELARQHPLAMVPDRQGTGTTMITALPGMPVTPLFGEQSCRAHNRAGHTILTLPIASTLRQDVDTLEDLEQALGRGVGKYTRSAVPDEAGRGATSRVAPLARHTPAATAV